MVKKIVSMLLISGALFLAGGVYYLREKKKTINPLVLHTEYGDFTVAEPILIDLINDKYVQRLKHVRQYGPRHYLIKQEDYNRFDHSVGVFLLLRRYGASLNEQIAGLLHDASHTVFSHVGDFLFKAGDAYQDDIHESFIKKTTIATVLENHTVPVNDILHKNESFTALERELPDLCADRLEYNLKGGLVEGLLTQTDIATILDSLVFENGEWFFTDVQHAKKFAYVPLHLMQNVWSSPAGIITYTWTSEALARALAIGLITLDDVHYSTDDVVWNKLVESDDMQIQALMGKLMQHKEYFTVVADDGYDTIVKGKFRGINPWVKTVAGVQRLTELDKSFNDEYNTVKQRMEAGWKIKFLNA